MRKSWLLLGVSLFLISPGVTPAEPHQVTEFAVPVAVPVAPLAPVWYGYSAGYGSAHSATSNDEAWIDQLAEKVATRLKNSAIKPAEQTRGLKAPSAAQRCLECHSGAASKGNFRLDPLELLSADQRLRAVRAIVAEKMPPDAPPITPVEAGKLILELTRERAEQKQVNPVEK